MCSFQDKLGVKVTPRCLWENTWCRVTVRSFSGGIGLGLLVVKIMKMVFVALIDTSHCAALLFIQSKSLFIFAAHKEISLLTMWNTDELSGIV